MSFHSFDEEKFDRWKAALTRAYRQPGWDQYDAELLRIVNSFDQFNSPKGGYVPPRWELMKALLWVEGGGPGQEEAWAHMPMQIGVRGDPGIIDVMTSPHVALIAAPEMRRSFDAGTIRTNPVVNIAAGMTLLHLKMAFFSKRPHRPPPRFLHSPHMLPPWRRAWRPWPQVPRQRRQRLKLRAKPPGTTTPMGTPTPMRIRRWKPSCAAGDPSIPLRFTSNTTSAMEPMPRNFGSVLN